MPAARGWLGLGFTHRAAQGTAHGWLVVTQLDAQGPAARAGLRVQDVVTEINGKPLTFKNDAAVLDFFASLHAGDVITFTVVRRNATHRVTMHAAMPRAKSDARWESNYDLATRKDLTRKH